MCPMHIRHLMAMMTALCLLSACGDPDPVALVATTPADGATDVALDTEIAVTVSRPVDIVTAQLDPQVPLRLADSRRDGTDWVVEYTLEEPLAADSDYLLSIGVVDTSQRFEVEFGTIAP